MSTIRRRWRRGRRAFVDQVAGHPDVVGGGEAGDRYGERSGSGRNSEHGHGRRCSIGERNDDGSATACRYIAGGVLGPGIKRLVTRRRKGVRSGNRCRPSGGCWRRGRRGFVDQVAGHPDVVGGGEAGDRYGERSGSGRNSEHGHGRRCSVRSLHNSRLKQNPVLRPWITDS